MQAVVQDSYGTADVLRLAQVVQPEVADDDVLIRVRAAGVHIGDWHLMMGQPYLMRVMGFGFRAPKAPGPRPGCCWNGRGDRQERDPVPGRRRGVRHLRRLFRRVRHRPKRTPSRSSRRTSPSSRPPPYPLRPAPLCRHCAPGKIASGQQVLIIGASGGVGVYAVQIAKSFGAEVTGVSSPAKVDLVRSLGADAVLDYTKDELTADGSAVRPDSRHGRESVPVRASARSTPKGTLVLVGGEGGGRLIGGAMGRLAPGARRCHRS